MSTNNRTDCPRQYFFKMFHHFEMKQAKPTMLPWFRQAAAVAFLKHNSKKRHSSIQGYAGFLRFEDKETSETK